MRKGLFGHRAAVNVVDFDEKHIVSASGDRTIKVWTATTCEFVRTLSGHRRGIGKNTLVYQTKHLQTTFIQLACNTVEILLSRAHQTIQFESGILSMARACEHWKAMKNLSDVSDSMIKESFLALTTVSYHFSRLVILAHFFLSCQLIFHIQEKTLLSI